MSRPQGCRKVLAYLGLTLLILSCGLVLPCMQKVRDGEGWVYSQNNLRQVGMALVNYQDVYKKLPPAVVTDKAGRPLYSWRVLLLPFLEQDSLYKQLHPDEPWDGPHNKGLLEETPPPYTTMDLGRNPPPPGMTCYLVFVGPGTPFERPGLSLKDFRDRLADTILVVEAGEPVPWAKPADLTYDPTRPLPALGGIVEQPVHFLCYEVSQRPGFNAVFADGSARFLRSDAEERTIRALISRNGGEKRE